MSGFKLPTRLLCAVSAILALAACTSEPQPTASNEEAQAFAARINGSISPSAGNQPPKVAQPLPAMTNHGPTACGAEQMRAFIGKVANVETRTAIVDWVAGAGEVRFLRPGSALIDPDPANTRLNLLLDSQDIIREARCG